MRGAIFHSALRRLAAARLAERGRSASAFGLNRTAARARSALFSVSAPVRLAVKAYLFCIFAVSAAAGGTGCACAVRLAGGLPLLRVLNLLIFSWIDLCACARRAGTL